MKPNKGTDNQKDRQTYRQTAMEMTDNRDLVFVIIILMFCYVYVKYF